MPTFLVTGATGRQGGSTARQLLAKGAKVHALVRNPNSEAAKAIQSEGATLFQGDSADAKAISQALEGVTGVFYNPPYPGPDHRKTNEIFIQACVERKDTVATLVISTASGTEKHADRVKADPNYTMVGYFTEKAALEDEARAAEFQNLIILRPSFLMHEYLLPDSAVLFPGLEQRRLVTALKPNTVVPHLVAEDVGNFAAAALLDPSTFSNQEINLAGDNLTLCEAAEILGDVAGVKIEAPLAIFEDDKAVGVGSPLTPYHYWANGIDARVDVAALRKSYGVPVMGLREFLTARKGQLREAVGA